MKYLTFILSLVCCVSLVALSFELGAELKRAQDIQTQQSALNLAKRKARAAQREARHETCLSEIERGIYKCVAQDVQFLGQRI